MEVVVRGQTGPDIKRVMRINEIIEAVDRLVYEQPDRLVEQKGNMHIVSIHQRMEQAKQQDCQELFSHTILYLLSLDCLTEPAECQPALSV